MARAVSDTLVNDMRCRHDPVKESVGDLDQYHCPVCGMMVVNGLEHPKFVVFRNKEDVQDEEVLMLGDWQETGWHITTTGYDCLRPTETKEEAIEKFKEHYKRATGREWRDEDTIYD